MEWSYLETREAVLITPILRIAVGTAALICVASSVAQQQLYRYTEPDGRTVYTDRAPPANAKNAQSKRMGVNTIETNELTFQAQQATERFPVTLYTFDCGEVCSNAEALLNRRGVPFSTVNVQEKDGQTRLQLLTGGELQAPVLTVGDKLVAKGYSETRWQTMLDQAGYPKAPAPRRTAPIGRVADAPASASARGVAEPRSVVPPVRGGEYPK